jgi:hypothetical protein
VDEHIPDGINPKNPNAEFSLHEHFRFGSGLNTQFISMTTMIEVAMLYAVKGAIQCNVRPTRVAQISLGMHDGKSFFQGGYECRGLGQHEGDMIHSVPDCVRYDWLWTARNVANTFNKLCVERFIGPMATT